MDPLQNDDHGAAKRLPAEAELADEEEAPLVVVSSASLFSETTNAPATLADARPPPAPGGRSWWPVMFA